MFEWQVAPTGRFAALKVVGYDVGTGAFAIASLDPIFAKPPSLSDIEHASILIRHRFAFDGKAAVLLVDSPASETDVDLMYLGRLPVTTAESWLANSCSTFGKLRSSLLQADLEWRWEHDRDALEADWARRESDVQARRAAIAAHYESRLKGLTFGQLLSEVPFQSWDGPPPYPPEAFTRKARKRVLAAVGELDALGKRPGKRATRAIIRELVDWFNEVDEREEVIETVERENICEVLAEMLHVAKHQGLIDEVDAWRTW